VLLSPSSNISEKIEVWQPEVLSESDVAWLAQRFGVQATLPVAVVARRDVDKVPVVVKMPLVRNGEPFPTLYWLTDPILTPLITALEYAGGVAQAELLIRENSDAHRIFMEQHARYISARWSTATEEHRELMTTKGYHKRLLEVGIGGVTNFTSIKCIHLHVAHYLATKDNIVGEWALVQIGTGSQMGIT